MMLCEKLNSHVFVCLVNLHFAFVHVFMVFWAKLSHPPLLLYHLFIEYSYSHFSDISAAVE